MSRRKPSNCSCGPGGHRSWGDKWVVIDRRKLPKTSRLKCLRCGWRWWSGKQYVAALPDHVELATNGMSDGDIIERIAEGTLTVLVDVPRVFSYSKSWGWIELKQLERESNGSTYRFVTIWYRQRKKKIAVHRLNWMFANRQLVPSGYDVDHIDGRSDAISNLRLVESAKNRSKKHVEEEEDDVPF